MNREVDYSTITLFDVISSPRFVHGHKPYHETYPLRDDSPQFRGRTQSYVGHTNPPKHHAHSDPSRAEARFVVLELGWDQDTDQFGDPMELHFTVVAKRLHADGTFDEDGEVIVFNMYKGWRGPVVDSVTWIRRMQLV